MGGFEPNTQQNEEGEENNEGEDNNKNSKK